eukprot:scaffold7338_cov107-Cylindrotheca_fusiformis.AAC.4
MSPVILLESGLLGEEWLVHAVHGMSAGRASVGSTVGRSNAQKKDSLLDFGAPFFPCLADCPGFEGGTAKDRLSSRVRGFFVS